MAAWLDRQFRLLPGLRIAVRTLAVDGWPWGTRVGVEWFSTGVLSDGSTYTGAQILRVHNAKIIAFHAYLHDVDAFTAALARLSAHGVTEAAAPPILTGAPRSDATISATSH